MKLNEEQWAMTYDILVSIAFSTKSKRLMKVCNELGMGGENAVSEGVDPVVGPPRHQLVHALRLLVAEVGKLNSEHVSDNLLEALVVAEEILFRCENATTS